MISSNITLPYHIISYHILCSFILSPPSILFYSTLFQIDSIWFYFILFSWIWFTILFSRVSHINEWFVSVCPSVCLSVCLFICMNKCMFSLLSCFFILSLLFLFSFHFNFSFFTLFSHEHLPHTHGHGHTHTYKYIFLLMTRTYYFNSM